MTLWGRRMASEGVSSAKPIGVALTSRSTAFLNSPRKGEGAGGGQRDRAGPSFAHEIDQDPKGVAFAFGGVDPGTLHAKGHLVKVHNVHYSIGRAGMYRLHVALRQQAAVLPGSPFELTISPGVAHREMTRLDADSLPLRGVVGSESGGVVLVTSDRMGNRCLVGSAPVNIHCPNTAVSCQCIDKGDGTYSLHWQSQAAGEYKIHVTIDGLDVAGSPTTLLMSASRPDCERFEVDGGGLNAAVAGQSAALRIKCRDTFGNLCALAGTAARFGLALLSPAGGASKGDEGEESSKSKKSKEAGGKSREQREREQQRSQALAFEAIEESMPFEGRWVEDDSKEASFEMLYTAKQAGEFELHVWYVAEAVGAAHEKLPGSPFSLCVSEGKANPSGCMIRGAQQLREERTIPAGQEISLYPQLKDQFGNASSASDGALTASLEGPMDSVDNGREGGRGGAGGTAHHSGSSPMGSPHPPHTPHTPHSPSGSSTSAVASVALPVRKQQGLGAYEVRCEPHLHGLYRVHVSLHGSPISDSPVVFEVVPGAPLGAKSRLLPPAESTQKIGDTPCELLLECLDKFGNIVRRGGASVAARALGPGTSACTVEDLENGRYLIRFTQAAAGECKVMVRLDNQDVPPMSVMFAGGDKKSKKDEGGGAAAAAGEGQGSVPPSPRAAAPSSTPPPANGKAAEEDAPLVPEKRRRRSTTVSAPPGVAPTPS
jgi:hypothetical protein